MPRKNLPNYLMQLLDLAHIQILKSVVICYRNNLLPLLRVFAPIASSLKVLSMIKTLFHRHHALFDSLSLSLFLLCYFLGSNLCYPFHRISDYMDLTPVDIVGKRCYHFIHAEDVEGIRHSHLDCKYPYKGVACACAICLLLSDIMGLSADLPLVSCQYLK